LNSSPAGRRLPDIELALPAQDGGASVFAALQRRSTQREISATPLPPQVLSNLLWAACGVNRSIGPFGICGRTAASASNSQEIDLYVALKDGMYRYDAVANRLTAIIAGDHRSLTLTPGQQGVKPGAPVQLIFVVDMHRLTHTAGFQEPGLEDPEIQKAYYFVDTGIMAGNVYPFAAVRHSASFARRTCPIQTQFSRGHPVQYLARCCRTCSIPAYPPARAAD